MRVFFIARLAVPDEEAIFDKTFDSFAGESFFPLRLSSWYLCLVSCAYSPELPGGCPRYEKLFAFGVTVLR